MDTGAQIRSRDGRERGPRFLAFLPATRPARASDRKGTPAMAAPSRLDALSGLAGIALFAVGWFWDPIPPNDWSDSRLDAYLSTHTPTTPWLVVSVVQLLAVPFLWRFATVLSDRLAAGGASSGLRRAAHGAARAFAISVLVFALLYAALPVGAVFGFRPPSA